MAHQGQNGNHRPGWRWPPGARDAGLPFGMNGNRADWLAETRVEREKPWLDTAALAGG
jgi:hypothetical protein